MTPLRLGAIAVALAGLLGAGLLLLPRGAAADVPLAVLPMPACSTPGPATGRVFHVDPRRGSPAGDGSAARPWRDLRHLVAAGLLGESERRSGRVDRWIGRLLGRAPAVRLEQRAGARLRAGDTLLLASGDYGPVDLANLANRGFVTIAAAPGAAPRFASLELAGASHFILRGIRIAAADAAPGRRQLVSLYRAGGPRADNIVLEGLEIASTRDIAASDPDTFAARAPDGIALAGDCLTLRGSRVEDVMTAVSIYRARHVLVAGNAIRDFAADGIQFSGAGIAIRDNLVADQWPTASALHPDCIQGAEPRAEPLGPVAITGNLCIRALAATAAAREGRPDRFGWQGITIFDGRWRGVTVRCNLVLPAAQHGIALYGTEDALIEGNVVLGLPGGRPSWIGAMPAKSGRQSVGVVIRGNRASAYLNAVKDAPLPLDAMLDLVRIGRSGEQILATALRGPVEGVTLTDNVWEWDGAAPLAAAGEKRFAFARGPAGLLLRDAAEALRLHPLPASCG